MSNHPTPYYLLDQAQIERNLQAICEVTEPSGAKALLALKCFATHGAFDFMRPYLAGTTSSSLYEVRLGAQEFGKETHAYSVAYSADEIDEVLDYADKIIFNSKSQLDAFADRARAKGIPIGLRLNPLVSNSSFLIADPSRPFSRLGVSNVDVLLSATDIISGVMIHNNCENADFDAWSDALNQIETHYGALLSRLEWVSLGGGIHMIGEYPRARLAQRLKTFASRYGVCVYLEPGEACIHKAAKLIVRVLDVMEADGKTLAVVDASIEAHMLDLLIYREQAILTDINSRVVNLTSRPIAQTQYALKTAPDATGGVRIYGKSCLSGDIFGDYAWVDDQGCALPPLKVGDVLAFGNAAGYTMVKKNWFNGLNMPAIVIQDPSGKETLHQAFEYQDYKEALGNR